MMKTEKNRLMDVKAKGAKWLSLALCLTAGFSFSACSDDDGEGGGGAGSGVAAQQMPKVADAGIQFPVTQYSEYYGSYIETYTYSNGRMTGGSYPYGSISMGTYSLGIYSISSNPLVLTEQRDDRSSTFRNIRVNGNGFMTYAELFSDNDRGSFTWRYDAEGHLLSESGNMTYSDGGSSSWTCTNTWENGNLMNAEFRYEEDGEVDSEVCTFTYGDGQWNNPGVYPAHWIKATLLEMPILFYSGLMGRTTKNIPTSVTRIDFDGNETTYNTVAVNYNQDRSIQSIEVQNVSSYGSSYTDIYRFGYADYPIQQQSGYSATPAWKSPKAVHSLKARRMMKRK